MIQVNILNEFNTSMGLIIVVKTDDVFRIGNTITDGNNTFIVKGFPISAGCPKGYDAGEIDVLVERLN